jgi:RNA polymerase sigma-70 factor (ECF subfamily)
MAAQFRAKDSAQRGGPPPHTARAVRPEAFDREAVAQFAGVQRAARRLTGSASDAEDLVQETYVRALRGADQFRAGTNFKAWLLTILRHVHLNRRRQAARAIVEVDEAKVDRFAEAAAHGDTPERRLLGRVLDERLQAAHESLPLSLRQTLWLRDMEGLSYAEIARRLGIPVGTVMSRLARARQLLFKRVNAQTP